MKMNDYSHLTLRRMIILKADVAHTDILHKARKIENKAITVPEVLTNDNYF